MFMIIATVYLVLQAAVLSNGKPQGTYLKATMPANCTKNYCTIKGDDYPQKLIDELIERENVLETYVDLDDRSSDGEHVSECKTTKSIDTIYKIKDNSDTVRYVIQSSDNATKRFQQKLTMRECVNPGKITKNTKNLHLQLSSLSPYEFFCEQTIIDYSFLVLSLDGKKLEAVQAKNGIPVCCKCIVKEK